MNEYTAKKLGEVSAFAHVALDLYARAGIAMREARGNEVGLVVTHNSAHHERLRAIAKEGGISDIMEAKEKKTVAKITGLMEMYIGDQWENPIEVFEWLGFFEGACLVHWSLVAGMAQSLHHGEIAVLSQEAVNFHTQELAQVQGYLERYGEQKASEVN